MRILLVEDDEKLNQSLAFQLKDEGFLTDSCRDGEEALYYIGEHIHDLILLDRMLPEDQRHGSTAADAGSRRPDSGHPDHRSGYAG